MISFKYFCFLFRLVFLLQYTLSFYLRLLNTHHTSLLYLFILYLVIYILYLFIQPYKYHKLEGYELPNSATLTRDQAFDYYRKMVVIRRMEQEASKLYKERVIRGFCHLYSGQVFILFSLV